MTKTITSQDDVRQLGTILGVWAHPDDETFSMAGIMMAAVENGQTVAFITMTRGEKGIQDESRWPADKLGEIRTKELAAAMEILGVKKHIICDFPDGGCEDCDQEEAIQKIVDCINKYQPDSILTFGPEGLTGHPDHQAVSKWAKKARKLAGSKAKIFHATLTPKQHRAAKEADNELDLFFNIAEPPVCVMQQCAIHFELSEELCERKVKALLAMPSQYSEMEPFFGKSLRITFGTEAFTDERET